MNLRIYFILFSTFLLGYTNAEEVSCFQPQIQKGIFFKVKASPFSVFNKHCPIILSWLPYSDIILVFHIEYFHCNARSVIDKVRAGMNV